MAQLYPRTRHSPATTPFNQVKRNMDVAEGQETRYRLKVVKLGREEVGGTIKQILPVILA